MIYHPTKLADFIHLTLSEHDTLTHLVICMTKQDFTDHLQHSIKLLTLQDGQQEEEKEEEEEVETHPLLTPTLRMLSTSRHICVAFCPSVRVLQAYLATLPKPVTDVTGRETKGTRQMLALVNAILLHAQTGSYSAQGLSKTFAAAVECALRGNQRLVVVEAVDQLPIVGGGEEREMHEGFDQSVEGGQQDTDEVTSVWDRQVPILNAATRTFGVGGDRAWLGKTVSLRQVAARYCRLEALEHD